MELVIHTSRLGMPKGRQQELCNTFVEILGLASEKKSNSSSQLKQGLVQKVGIMRGLITDLIIEARPAYVFCFPKHPNKMQNTAIRNTKLPLRPPLS